MQRAGRFIAAFFQSQQATLGKGRPFGQQQNLHQSDLVAPLAQTETTETATKGKQQVALGQALQDLGQIGCRHPQFGGDVLIQHRRGIWLGRHVNQRLDGILTGA